jgi:DNA recombination-dependent growth factor C
MKTPRKNASARDKREELTTYRELKLGRELKSARLRKKVEAGGQRRVLGNGSSSQPYLAVETKRYREVRFEIQKRLLLQAKREGLLLPADLLLEQLTPRIEALTYAQMADEAAVEASRHVPVAALGRALTSEERARFAATKALAGEATPGRAAKASARVALDHVLGHIEQRQSHNPARYQTIWAQVVGGEAAQQSFLEQVDAATQTAWFRCYNSVLSADIQRRPVLVTKLAKALGVPIRKLRAKF